MSQHSLKLPDHLEDAAVKIAQKKRLSLNQFFVAAIAEKISALEADDLLNNMAEKSDERAFFDALAKVPDGDVIEGDECI